MTSKAIVWSIAQEILDLVQTEQYGNHRHLLRPLQNQLATEFGRQRGLIYKPMSRWSLDDLGQKTFHSWPVLEQKYPQSSPWHSAHTDHSYFYREGRKLVAVASHIYSMTQEWFEKIQKNLDPRLSVEWVKDFPSWWY